MGERSYQKLQYFYVEVTHLSGKRQIFQLPKDLQEPMRTYQEEYPKSWKALLTGALINVPSASYNISNNFQPTIRLTKVTRVFCMKHQQKKRSRGQFLILENWQRRGWCCFWDSVRFIQHDYSKRNQLVLLIDYYRWRSRHFRKKK